MNHVALRLASLALAALVAPSCLVTAKQDFPAPPQTAPFLSASDAKPSLEHLVIDVDGKQKITFDTTVRSEDDGVPLEARLIYDDPFPETARYVLVDRTFIEASTFADVGRHVTLTFDPAVPLITKGTIGPGCHRFTLLVSHSFRFPLNQPETVGDQDFLVWWVVVGDPKDPSFAGTVTAASCTP